MARRKTATDTKGSTPHPGGAGNSTDGNLPPAPSYCVSFDTPLVGRVTVWASDKGISRIELTDSGDASQSDIETEGPAQVNQWVSTLRAYLRGDAVDPAKIPVDFTSGTQFQRAVWNALRTVKRGEVRTYASIAAQVGSPRATRAVGQANSVNPIPIVVPCHRVVAAGTVAHGLELGGFSAGMWRKIAMLELEGIAVRGGNLLPQQQQLKLT